MLIFKKSLFVYLLLSNSFFILKSSDKRRPMQQKITSAQLQELLNKKITFGKEKDAQIQKKIKIFMKENPKNIQGAYCFYLSLIRDHVVSAVKDAR